MRHVALLRGINVGGKNKLPMKDLAKLFVDADCGDVQTYIQSGNVVFSASASLARQISRRIERAVADRFGFQSPVVVRSAADLGAVVDGNPFLKARADLKTLHVAFLAGRPSKARIAALDPKRSPPDQFAAAGSHIYLMCPNGMARTKLTNAYLDATLGTVSTVRNWNTVLRLATMSSNG